MNIQELHNRLIKRASMQKVAGPTADKLRKLIGELNGVRSNKKVIDRLNKSNQLSRFNLLNESLRPYTTGNEYLSIKYDLPKLRLSMFEHDANLEKLKNRIIKNVESRKDKIRDLGGWDAARAYERSIINKHVKDIA